MERPARYRAGLSISRVANDQRLERHTNRDREHRLSRITEDVAIASLEIDGEAAQWQIVPETGIDTEVPRCLSFVAAKKRLQTGVLPTEVAHPSGGVETAIRRGLTKVEDAVEGKAVDAVLRSRVAGVVAPWQ